VGLTRGAAWPGFAPTTIIVIFNTSAIIDVFRLWDAIARLWFWRFTGIVIADALYVAGVVPVRPVVATPAPQGSSDVPRLQGTYAQHTDIQTPSGHYSNDKVATAASDCGGCNATATSEGGSATLEWTGSGWSSTSNAQCGSVTTTYTPTAVVNGIVEGLSGHFTVCDTDVTFTWKRTGD
jgi:hypothetical protein